MIKLISCRLYAHGNFVCLWKNNFLSFIHRWKILVSLYSWYGKLKCFTTALRRLKRLISLGKRDQKGKMWIKNRFTLNNGKLLWCKRHTSRFADIKVCTNKHSHTCMHSYGIRGSCHNKTNFPCLIHNKELNFQAIFLCMWTQRNSCAWTLGNGKSKSKKRRECRGIEP